MGCQKWAFILACTIPTVAYSQTVLSGTYETPNAVSDISNLCPPNSGKYPTQWTWNPNSRTTPPRRALVADHLTPRIEQHRQVGGTDTIVAVWSSFASGPNCQEIFRTTNQGPYTPAQLQQMAATGCGPFGNTSHVDLFRLWQAGDVFEVYPAIYTGTDNNIVLHAQSDYYDGSTDPVLAPSGITIQGVVQNGIRPVIVRNDGGGGDSETGKDAVEILAGMNDTIDNVDVLLGPKGYVSQALVYLIGAGTANYDANGNRLATPTYGGTTTLSHMHVSYAELVETATGGASGIFGDTTGGGEIMLSQDELDHDGGSGVQNSSGPGHGVYIGSSTVDPNLILTFANDYFHDNYYGHDAKSRAPYTNAYENYFKGGLPQGGVFNQAEAFNLDVPNGGTLTAYGNIFVKNQAGPNSNGYGIAYGEEGIPDSRPLSLTVEWNTFVAFAWSYDGSHPNIPFEFFYPAQMPGAGGFPVSAQQTLIAYNAFVGYCPTGNPTSDYRGSTALIAGFGDLSRTFSLGGHWLAPSQLVAGLAGYNHVDLLVRRLLTSVGAED